MRTTLRGGIVRAVVVALTGALVAVGGAGAAQAADSKPVIDSNAKGSITIHKLEYPDKPLDLPNNGTQQNVPAGTATPLADVTFKVEQVLGYDLTKNADWLALKALTPDAAASGNLGTAQSISTDVDGIAKFEDLAVGVYLVTETGYPDGATPVDPFLVTVPLTDPTNSDAWVYDVHVYPKNSISTATKTVDDDTGYKLGDTVTFTIQGDIPEVEVIDGYKVVDVLDSRLDYKDAAVSLTNGAALAVDDYTITHDAGTVTVQFNASGLAKLADNSGAQVQVVIKTTVNAIGEITNKAYVYPNEASFDAKPGEGGPTVTPEVETKWGNVTIKKVAKGTDTGLEGAEFAVYPTREAALAGTDPIMVGTTTSDGTLTFTGLRYSEWADGEELQPTDPRYRTYWIVETNPPAGYVKLSEPIEVVVDDTDTVIDFKVENVRHESGFDLPLTGGTGTLALTAAGVLLIAGALLLASRNRRREAVGA